MCRRKWFVPADERSFDPVGGNVTRQREIDARIGCYAEGTKPSRAMGVPSVRVSRASRHNG